MTLYSLRVMWKRISESDVVLDAPSAGHARRLFRDGLRNGTIQPPEPGMDVEFIPEVTEVHV